MLGVTAKCFGSKLNGCGGGVKFNYAGRVKAFFDKVFSCFFNRNFGVAPFFTLPHEIAMGKFFRIF